MSRTSASDPAAALRLRATMAARDAFAGADRAAGALHATRAAAEAYDQAWHTARADVEDAGPIACRAGCDACCYQHVAVLPLEALAIATALRREEPGDQHALRARLVSTDAMTRDFDAPTRRRARIACAFLGAAGRCDIYEIRPLRCRGLHSRDAELCRRQTDHPDLAAAERARQPDPHPAFPLEPVRLADAGLAGLAAVCAERGIAHEPLELMRAVQLLLDDPDRMRGLLDGADGLVEARLDLAARPMAKR